MRSFLPKEKSTNFSNSNLYEKSQILILNEVGKYRIKKLVELPNNTVMNLCVSFRSYLIKLNSKKYLSKIC